MASLTQAPATRERLNELVAELFGDQPTPPPQAPASLSTADQRWQQAVTQVGEQLRAKLCVEILPERMRKALELQPEQPHVLNYLGYSWIDQGINLDEGMKMIRRAVDQRPDDGYIVDSLGWAFYRIGNFEDAVKNLERAIDLKPDHGRGHVAMARIYMERRMFADAAAEFDRQKNVMVAAGLVADDDNRPRAELETLYRRT